MTPAAAVVVERMVTGTLEQPDHGEPAALSDALRRAAVPAEQR